MRWKLKQTTITKNNVGLRKLLLLIEQKRDAICASSYSAYSTSLSVKKRFYWERPFLKKLNMMVWTFCNVLGYQTSSLLTSCNGARGFIQWCNPSKKRAFFPARLPRWFLTSCAMEIGTNSYYVDSKHYEYVLHRRFFFFHLKAQLLSTLSFGLNTLFWHVYSVYAPTYCGLLHKEVGV